MKLFELLGGATCSCSMEWCCWHERICGVNDIQCLTFDHINGDGSEDRKRFYGRGGGLQFYRYYANHPEEARSKLQVYCENCNKKKAMMMKEYLKNMPHF